MKLILTRHGVTEENINGILQSHMDGTLSKLGLEQAKKVSLRLKNEKIDYIYSSDLGRASKTAQKIAKYHKKTPIKFVKELREIDHGDYAGMKLSGYNEYKNKPKNKGFNEGENVIDLFNRAKIFFI